MMEAKCVRIKLIQPVYLAITLSLYLWLVVSKYIMFSELVHAAYLCFFGPLLNPAIDKSEVSKFLLTVGSKRNENTCN